MPLTPAQVAYVRSLAPRNPTWGGTGAVYREPGPLDRSALQHPAIAANVAAGVTFGSVLKYVTGPSYDQGQYGACVAASTCSDGSVSAALAGQPWPTLDWLTLYHENGGILSNGVDTVTVLKDVIANGYPYQGRRYPAYLKSYLWVPQAAQTFRQTIVAALAAGEPVTIALLLPENFGWSSSGNPTTGYHQVLGVEGDLNSGWCTIFNSWSDSWPGAGAPRGGLGRVSWDYLEANANQNGYCYAYLTTPLATPPPPPPTTLSVTGYSVNAVQSDQSFQVFGTGFGPTAQASFGGQPVPVQSRAPTILTATGPVVPTTTVAPITVTSGGQSAQGPPLTVTPPPGPPPVNQVTVAGVAKGPSVGLLAVGQSLNLGPDGTTLQITQITGGPPPPPPPPPGAFTVHLNLQRVATHFNIFAWATTSLGASVNGRASGTTEQIDLQTKPCSATPAVWSLPADKVPVGSAVTVTITDGSGATATTTQVAP